MPTFEQVIWMVGRGKDHSKVVPFRCLEFLNDFGENGKKHSAIAVEFQLFLESGREQLFLFIPPATITRKLSDHEGQYLLKVFQKSFS